MTRKRYQIGELELSLSPGHLLAEFQKSHRLYDRFLPYLAKHIDAESTIVDVGANIGDTAYLMTNETDARIVCIEGSKEFYAYLTKNIESLPSSNRNRISCINALVSQQSNQGSLQHINGTAKFVESKSSSAVGSRTLDDIIKDETKVSLIKVDTDGYDHDVLLSGVKSIKQHQPLLFWENVIESDKQLGQYAHLYSKLVELGYTKIYVFDNFGNFLIADNSFDSQGMINNYVYSILKNQDTTTIHYTDTLAVTAKDESWVDSIIESYKKDVILA